MRRGTTPTITLSVDGNIVDWTIFVSFSNGGEIVTFEDDRLVKSFDGIETQIEITLTQDETLAFVVGIVEVQIRAYKDGAAVATDIKTMNIGRILKDGVIPDGE